MGFVSGSCARVVACTLRCFLARARAEFEKRSRIRHEGTEAQEIAHALSGNSAEENTIEDVCGAGASSPSNRAARSSHRDSTDALLSSTWQKLG